MRRSFRMLAAPRRLIAIVYLIFGLPLALRFAIETAPFDTPDEPAHFLRAVQVADGGWRAVRLSGTVGGALPSGAIAATGLCTLFRDHPTIRLDRATLARFRAIRWDRSREAVGFTNTAAYPPVFYAVEALAIDAGRHAGLPVLATFRLGRVVDAIAATIVATAALLLAEAGTPLLGVVLSMPMTLSLFGSASQDGLLIAGAALAAALLTRRAFTAPSLPAVIAIGLLLGAIAAARPPYLALAPLPLVVAAPGARWRGGLASALALTLAFGWLAIGADPVASPTRAGGSLFGGAQAHWLWHHPGAVPAIAVRTLGDWRLRFDEFVGVLGWLDITLPGRVYRLAELVLLVAGALVLLAGDRPVAPRTPVLLALVATTALTELALYLAWSRLGAPAVAGVQGRYFIPPACFAALLGRRGSGRTTETVAVLAMASMLLAGHLAAAPLVAARFAPH